MLCGDNMYIFPDMENKALPYHKWVGSKTISHFDFLRCNLGIGGSSKFFCYQKENFFAILRLYILFQSKKDD